MGKYSWRCQKAGGNHKSVQTKLPAALKRITAVHHGALDDTLHQPKTTRLHRKSSLFPAGFQKRLHGMYWGTKSTSPCCCADSHALISLAFMAIILSKKYKQLLERRHSSRSSLPWSWMDIWPWTPLWEATCVEVPSVQSQPWQIKLDFLVSTGFSWKTTFSVQRSQIWTVWENGQMAVRWKFGGEKNSSGILEACTCCLVWCASKDKTTCRAVFVHWALRYVAYR